MVRNFNPCRVCNAPGNGIHFGVDACRGCTAFFRRTVVQNKQYLCNQDESCEIGNAERLVCRSCRYAACLKVGMRREAVQNHRDPYGRREQEVTVPSLSSSSRLSFPVPALLLSGIGNSYAQLENIRSIVHNDGSSMFQKRAPKRMTYKETNKLLSKEFFLVADWISNSFPQFVDLPTHQKDLLMKNFYLPFLILEGGFFCCKKSNNSVFPLPNGDYVDCQNLATYYYDPNGEQLISPEDAARVFKGSCNSFRRNVTTPMLQENVNQFEFLALAALVLFDTALEGQSEECVEMCRNVRSTVQREMIQYYLSNNTEEHYIRMGNIISLLSNLQKSTHHLHRDMELGHLFNSYSIENKIYEKWQSVMIMTFRCRVCHTNESGVHFGADVCRACSAFFRRTVAKNQTYKCKANGTCEGIVQLPAMRTMCRRCRYAKCVKIGMKTDLFSAVQKNRDVFGKRGDVNPMPSDFVYKPIRPTMPLLEKIAENYGQLENVRLFVHNRKERRLFLNSHRTPRPVNYKESAKILMKEFQIVAEFVSNSFSCFSTLPDDQKDVLLRNFYLQFVILEGGFFSCRHRRNDIWFLPSGDYIDCANPETYYFDPEGLQPMTSEDAVKIFGSSFATYKRNVSHPMLRDDVDCFEFLTLAALALFATGVEGQSDICYELCRRMRETVQREILHYYQTTKTQEEAPMRLATILSILPNLQRAARRFQEDVELRNVLRAYRVDRNFYEKFTTITTEQGLLEMEKLIVLCQVCQDTAIGINFGVPSCGGCSAFFRRTVSKNAKYECVHQNSCEILSRIRTICKCCRFAKCLAVGMKTDAVQNQRESYGSYGKREMKEELPSSSSSSFPFMSGIIRSYGELENVRHIIHKDENLSIFMKREPRSLNYKESIEITVKEYYLLEDWVINSLPNFSSFPHDQRGVLFRSFFLQFTILEASYVTIQKERLDIVFMPSGDYIDIRNPENYYHDPDGEQPISSEQAAKIFGSSFDNYRRNVFFPMLKDQIDRFEFLALTALTLFDTGLEGQSDECIEKCRKVRETIQRELSRYLEHSKKCEDPAVRLGNMLSIMPNLQKAVRRMQEDMTLSNVFKAYAVGQQFYSLGLF
ncbi:unnamed protein product [Caenorhabditis sp. 36 PRJEB53466]|nr:unnamed protein product [Caenorhabditis sp. 36 PRJEB53466]